MRASGLCPGLHIELERTNGYMLILDLGSPSLAQHSIHKVKCCIASWGFVPQVIGAFMFKSCWDYLETIFVFRNHLYGICTSIIRGMLLLCWIHVDLIFVLFSATSECTHTLLACHAKETACSNHSCMATHHNPVFMVAQKVVGVE